MRATWVLLSTMLLIPMACGDDDDDDNDGATVGVAGNNQTGGTGGGTGGATSGTAGMGVEAGAETTASAGAEGETAGAGGMGGDTRTALTDGEILQVLDAANSGEIEQGELARELAVIPDVLEFAAKMVTRHTANRQEAESVANSATITLRQYPLAEELDTQSEAIVATLEATPEEQFDLLYMQLQVDVHSEVLELLDENLIPEAHAQEVQDFLTRTRSEVADHLERAQALVDALEE